MHHKVCKRLWRRLRTTYVMKKMWYPLYFKIGLTNLVHWRLEERLVLDFSSGGCGTNLEADESRILDPAFCVEASDDVRVRLRPEVSLERRFPLDRLELFISLIALANSNSLPFWKRTVLILPAA